MQKAVKASAGWMNVGVVEVFCQLSHAREELCLNIFKESMGELLGKARSSSQNCCGELGGTPWCVDGDEPQHSLLLCTLPN